MSEDDDVQQGLGVPFRFVWRSPDRQVDCREIQYREELKIDLPRYAVHGPLGFLFRTEDRAEALERARRIADESRGEPVWRTGRKLGRTLYRHGVCVGMVDTPAIAESIVAAMNAREEADHG